MNKSELIKEIAKKCELTENQSKSFLDNLTDLITDTLSKGEDITIKGLGKFYVSQLLSRAMKLPSGDTIELTDRYSPRFRPSRTLKENIR